MGFFVTESCTLQTDSSRRCRQAKPAFLPKNRVLEFYALPSEHAKRFPSQVLETQWEDVPTASATATDVVDWLSNDPIGISGGLNQYVFCGNDPVNSVDPYGRVSQTIGESIDGYMVHYEITPGGGNVHIQKGSAKYLFDAKRSKFFTIDTVNNTTVKNYKIPKDLVKNIENNAKLRRYIGRAVSIVNEKGGFVEHLYGAKFGRFIPFIAIAAGLYAESVYAEQLCNLGDEYLTMLDQGKNHEADLVAYEMSQICEQINPGMGLGALKKLWDIQ